jgi:hypothetical protein
MPRAKAADPQAIADIEPDEQLGPDQQSAIPGNPAPQPYDNLQGHDRGAETRILGHQAP